MGTVFNAKLLVAIVLLLLLLAAGMLTYMHGHQQHAATPVHDPRATPASAIQMPTNDHYSAAPTIPPANPAKH